MSADDAVGRSLALQHAHARLRLALDDALGTWHGIDLAQFAMLARLADAPAGRAPLDALAHVTGLSRSAVLRQVLALEKIGLVARAGPTGGATSPREVALRPAARTVLRVAADTVARVAPAALPSRAA